MNRVNGIVKNVYKGFARLIGGTEADHESSEEDNDNVVVTLVDLVYAEVPAITRLLSAIVLIGSIIGMLGVASSMAVCPNSLVVQSASDSASPSVSTGSSSSSSLSSHSSPPSFASPFTFSYISGSLLSYWLNDSLVSLIFVLAALHEVGSNIEGRQGSAYLLFSFILFGVSVPWALTQLCFLFPYSFDLLTLTSTTATAATLITSPTAALPTLSPAEAAASSTVTATVSPHLTESPSFWSAAFSFCSCVSGPWCAVLALVTVDSVLNPSVTRRYFGVPERWLLRIHHQLPGFMSFASPLLVLFYVQVLLGFHVAYVIAVLLAFAYSALSAFLFRFGQPAFTSSSTSTSPLLRNMSWCFSPLFRLNGYVPRSDAGKRFPFVAYGMNDGGGADDGSYGNSSSEEQSIRDIHDERRPLTARDSEYNEKHPATSPSRRNFQHQLTVQPQFDAHPPLLDVPPTYQRVSTSTASSSPDLVSATGALAVASSTSASSSSAASSSLLHAPLSDVFTLTSPVEDFAAFATHPSRTHDEENSHISNDSSGDKIDESYPLLARGVP